MGLWSNNPSTLALADGTAATLANSAAPDGFTPAQTSGTIVFRAAGAVGSLPAHWQFQGSVARGDIAVNSGTVATCVWGNLDEASYASGDSSLIRHFNASGSVTGVLKADRTIDITNYLGTVLASSPAIPLGADYRFALAAGKGTSTTTGTARAELYIGANAQGTTPDWSYNATNINAGTINFTASRFGKQTTGPTWGIRLMGMRGSDTQSDFSGNLSGPFAIGGSAGFSGSGSLSLGQAGVIAPVVFLGSGPVATLSGPSGTATVSPPAGLQAGDLMVMVEHNARGVVNSSAFTQPTSFDSFQTRTANGTADSATVGWTTRIYEPDDPASYTLTLGASEPATAVMQAYILAFRNVDLASLTNMGSTSANSATVDATTTTTVTPPTTPLHATNGGMAIALVTGKGNGGPYAAPAGWSVAQRVESATGVGVSSEAYIQNFGPGTTTSPAPAITGTAATKMGLQIALFPALPSEAGTGTRPRGSSQHGSYVSDPTVTVHKPLATQQGDLLIAAMVIDSDVSGVGLADMVAPSGWTTLLTQDVGAGTTGGAGTIRVWWKIAGASEPAYYQWADGTAGDTSIGIIAFSNAIPPTRWTTGTNLVTPSSSIAVPSIAGEAGAQLLAIVLAGAKANANRRFVAPAGFTDWVDERPTIGGGWVAIGMSTKPLTSTAATGTQTFTIQEQTTATSPFVARSDPSGSIALIIPNVVVGSASFSGSGSLGFTTGPHAFGGATAFSGSGGLSFVSTPAASGVLARSGSGSLGLSGQVIQGGSLTLAGAGSLVLAAVLAAVKGTLTVFGSGSLLVAGGGGASNLPLSGAGTLVFATSATGQRGTLAVSGSGSLGFLLTKVTAGGVLARTGSGALTFVQTFITARGTMARTGSGSLSLAMASWSTVLRKWSGSAWVQTLAQKWTGSAWVLAAVRRLMAKASLVLQAGPIYSDGAGAAGIFSTPYGRGPTGLPIARMDRGPGGIGSGAFLAANLPGPAGPVPAGTWFEVTWWERDNSATGSQSWSVVDDPATSTVAASRTYSRVTDWTFRRFAAQALVDWQTNNHKLRVGLFDEPGAFVEVSDPQLRIWA